MRFLFILFLVSCGSVQEKDVDYSLFEEFSPNVSEIGNKVFTKNGLNFKDYEITYYFGSWEALNTVCGEGLIKGCNFPDEQKIFVIEQHKDFCLTLAHELTHQALYLSTGDAGGDHKHEQFEQIKELCEEVL